MAFTVQRPAQGRTAGQCAQLCWQALFACDNGHSGRFGAEEMATRFAPDTRLDDIAQRLVCRTCGSREGMLDVQQDHEAAARRDHARFKADDKYRDL